MTTMTDETISTETQEGPQEPDRVVMPEEQKEESNDDDDDDDEATTTAQQVPVVHDDKSGAETSGDVKTEEMAATQDPDNERDTTIDRCDDKSHEKEQQQQSRGYHHEGNPPACRHRHDPRSLQEAGAATT